MLHKTLCVIVLIALTFYPSSAVSAKPRKTPDLVAASSEVKLATLPAVATPQQLIKQYSLIYDVPVDLLLRIASCESGFHPSAKNPDSSAQGIFQFINSTWISTRKEMGLDPSLTLKIDAEENIRTAVWKIAHGGLSAWNASKGCWNVSRANRIDQ